MSHNDDMYEEVHYSPLEYKIAMKVFKDLAPGKKEFLDQHVYIVGHQDWRWKKKQSLNQIDMYLKAHYMDLGEIITNMYRNIYKIYKEMIIEQDSKE